MSDPQINIEIEDVLASIRRLVSEGEAPRRSLSTSSAETPAGPEPVPTVDGQAMANAAVANSPAAPEKLVLSPEQMISAPVTKGPEDEAAAPLLLMPQAAEESFEDPADAQTEESVEPDHTDDILSLGPSPLDDATIALDDAAKTDGSGHDDEPDVSVDELVWDSAKIDNDAEPPAAEIQADEPQQDKPEIEPLSAVEAMWHSVRTAPVARDTGATAAVDRGNLLSTIEELEAAVSDAPDEFEPDGSETTPVVDWAETTANGAIFGARAAMTRIADVADLAKELAKLKPPPQPEKKDETPSAEEIIAEAVIDAEAEEIVSQLDDDLVRYLEEGAAVDEDTLREMVRGIIREELQGALGERITRNVRKLVRREIYRVMASEEFS